MTLKKGRLYFPLLDLRNFTLVWMTMGIALIRLGYGRARQAGSNGWTLDKTCSSLDFNFKMHNVTRIRSRHVLVVVVVVGLYTRISCMTRRKRPTSGSPTADRQDIRLFYS